MYEIFISYSRYDSDTTTAVADTLCEAEDLDAARQRGSALDPDREDGRQS
jgi:hypothetical protein